MKAALVARWPAPDGSQPSGALVASLLARWQNVDSSHTDQGTARKRKSELQTLRRQKCRDLNEIIATQSVDIAEADKLVSKLLVTRPDLVPQSSCVRDEAVESVKQEVTLAFHNLTKDLPERSRLKRTIVTRLCQIKGRMQKSSVASYCVHFYNPLHVVPSQRGARAVACSTARV
jgi:hypothetical protein